MTKKRSNLYKVTRNAKRLRQINRNRRNYQVNSNLNFNNEEPQVSQSISEITIIQIENIPLVQTQLTNNNGSKYIAIKNNENPSEFYCGKMDQICEFCNAKYFLIERTKISKRYNICCQNNKVKLNLLRESPKLIVDLLTNKHNDSKHFREMIRTYNNSLAFASMLVNIDIPRGFGPYCFKNHGQIYHRYSSLHNEGTPKYSQLYIYDSNEATNFRKQNHINNNCNFDLLKKLDELIREINPFAFAYKMMYEVEKEENEKAKSEGREPVEIRMQMRLQKNDDARRFNLPTTNEVAIVFRSNDGAPPLERSICIYPRNQPIKSIPIINPIIDPMVYPILFAYGDYGFNIGISHNIGNGNVTILEYYSYRLAIRENFNILIHSSRLTQQFIVDIYVRIEANNLNYIKSKESQKKLRVERYNGLMDHLNRNANDIGSKVGKLVILPSTFQGSPRAMQQNYQDAMTIVRNFGKPDLFITFTCNPNWQEIKENIFSFEVPSDRPDIVARIFKIKLKEFLKDIVEKHIFGIIIAWVYVIEFQKRGLPHAHILLFLKENDKIRDKEQVDKVVSAELPNPNENSRLYDYVTKFMIHGPCGKINQNSPCMNGNLCTKGFPKKFLNETNINVDGYPKYRRREDTGITFKYKSYIIDNRWIVPYNSWLILKYNAHINVEICSSVKSVKYLFKYVYKGYDSAHLQFNLVNSQTRELVHNEIEYFTESRYVSSPEAIWRISKFKMHDQSHTIIRLAIHLPEEQNVYFIEGNEETALIDQIGRNTMLTAFFKLNDQNDQNFDENAKNYLYSEIPLNYKWEKEQNLWVKRQRKNNNLLTRIYSVSPYEIERYHLRLLLLHVKGPKSFEDLKTIEGYKCDTFKESCRLRGFLADDKEWERCMDEAITFQMPKQLRQLFAFVCIFCQPADPLSFWNKYKDNLTEDFIQNNNILISENLALLEIANIFDLHNMSCSEIGLPQPNEIISDSVNEIYNIEAEREHALNNYLILNIEQKLAFDEIMKALSDTNYAQRCFFIDGPGGTGKTFLYNTIISECRSKNFSIISMAWTGIAATLLKGGTTVHSTFKFPVPLLENSMPGISVQSKKGKIFKDAKIIIWDEISMSSKFALDNIEKFLRDIMENNIPFGGKVIVVGGDFRQTLPVVLHGSPAQIIDNTVKNSNFWNLFKKFELKTNMRTLSDEKLFSDWLLKLGNGELRVPNLENDIIELDYDIVIKEQERIADIIFGKKIEINEVYNYSDCVILCPRNEDCYKINDEVIKKLNSESKTYLSIDKIECQDEFEQNNYPIEFINSLTPSGMPPHKLILKVGCIVMLLRNLHIHNGLCNGTRLIVKKLMPNVIDAEILTGSRKGDRVFIPRIEVAPPQNELPFKICRRQFPLRLSYAMTINKSQGQTLRKVGIYLPNPVFSHGQLYVAFSRVIAKQNLKVKLEESEKQEKLIRNSNRIFSKNIVFKEIL